MNRDTLNYVSRRIRESRPNDDPNSYTGEHNPPYGYPESGGHPISARYGNSTNTYRAEGVVEGRIEHHSQHDNRQGNVLRPIGFVGKDRKSKQDFMYELEESLEKEIDDIVYYSELALESEDKGYSEFADAFYAIAKCKLDCAEMIHHRLVKGGHYVPEKQSEIEERFDRAKHLFRRL